MTGEPRRRTSPANARTRRLLPLLALALFTLAPDLAGAAFIRTVVVQPHPVQMQIGQALQFRAFAIYNDETVQEITQVAEWTTGSSRVAIVSTTPGSRGVVTAVGPGTVKISAAITVDDDRTRGSSDVTVKTPPLAAITTRPTTKKLEVGKDSQFKATAVYVNEFTADVTATVEWSSTNPAVATVDNVGPTKGMVRPRAVGTTVIVARDPASNMTNTDGATEVRSPIVALEVQPREATLGRRMSFPMRCYGKRADGTRSNLTTDVDWGSTAPRIANVASGETQGGIVRTLATNGTAVIHCLDPERNLSTVTQGGGATVTVAGRMIGLEVRSVTLAVGEEKGARAFGILNDGNKTSDLSDAVNWSIVGPRIATVGNTAADRGDVLGLAIGTATLRATEPSTQLTSQEVDNLKVLGAIQSVAMEFGEGLVGRGEEVEYKARATYEGGDTSNISDKCEWSSDQTRIATVENVTPGKGIVRGVRKGTTTIRARCSGHDVSGPVQVIGTLLEIQVSPSTYDEEALTEKKFRALGLYDDGNQRDLTKVVSWSSSDPSVVSIDNVEDPGLAQLLKAGSATITATHLSNGMTSTATVVVEPGVQSLELVPALKVVRGSVSARFRAQGRRADGSIKVVTKKAVWSVDDPQIGRASNREGEQGTVFGGRQEGTTVVRATLPGGISATGQLTVQGLLVSFELLPESRTIPLLQARIVEARGRFTDGSTAKITRGVTFTSSNPNAVLVSNEPGSQGVMTAVGLGSAVVSAFDPASGKNADNTVSVVVTVP